MGRKVMLFDITNISGTHSYQYQMYFQTFVFKFEI
jgi:hypothetical protein